MKVFICMDKVFPRANAASNYIENMSKAIISQKNEVVVLSISDDVSVCQEWYQHNNIIYTFCEYCTIKKINTLESRLMLGKRMCKKIDESGINKGDIIICYMNNYFCLKSISLFGKYKGVQVINCVVEWYTVKQYKYGFFNPDYWDYLLGFYCGIKLNKKVIVISRNLEKHFQKKGCKTLILPPLIDIEEYKFESQREDARTHIIYAGNVGVKDSMDIMLESMLLLPNEIKEKVCFHVTGMEKNEILNNSKLPREKLKEINNNTNLVVFHHWMEYAELIELYQKMHFLLIARPKNRVTISNFPSKIPEAMCYGIIPIMTNVGDCPELYLEDGKDSILFNQCNVSDCMDAIIEAVNLSKEKRISMQNHARLKAERLFNCYGWGKKINNFICE